MELYFDLDDTFNECTLRCLNYVARECGYRGPEIKDFPIEAGYDIVKALHLKTGTLLTQERFWSAVPSKLWSTFPRSEEFWILLEVALKFNSFIVTHTTDDDASLGHKRTWIRLHAPRLTRKTFICDDKSKLAAPGRLLIDDCYHNCTLWIDKGGHAILIKRPWNELERLGKNIDSWGFDDGEEKLLELLRQRQNMCELEAHRNYLVRSEMHRRCGS